MISPTAPPIVSPLMSTVMTLDIEREVSPEDRELARRISGSMRSGDPSPHTVSSIEVERAWREARTLRSSDLAALVRLSARLDVHVPEPYGKPIAERLFGPARVDPATGATGRRTRILCTVGPASSDVGILARMIEAGMDGARINFSHVAEPTAARRFVDLLASAMERSGRKISVVADLQGPKIRIGRLDRPIAVDSSGSSVVLYTEGGEPPRGVIALPVAHPRVLTDLSPGDRVLVDDGKIELRVSTKALEGQGAAVRVEVLKGGSVSSRKGMNLPDTTITDRVPTEKDLRDIATIEELGIGVAMVSFVGDASDMSRVRERFRGPVRLIAKIERSQAVRNLEEIMRVSEGVLVARGDGAVELGDAEVQVLQRRIHALGNRFGVPTGTATQMMESMLTSPRPSRADASDVARAAFEGSEFVMTSAETAIGPDPVEVIRVMSRILEASERAVEMERT